MLMHRVTCCGERQVLSLSTPIAFDCKRGVLTFSDGTSVNVSLQEPIDGCTAVILGLTDDRRVLSSDVSDGHRLIYDVEFRYPGHAEICRR